MKVLVEGMTSGRGGKESYIMNMFRAMNNQGIKFVFIAYDLHIAYEDELRKAEAEIVNLPPRKKGLFKFRSAVHGFFQKNQFDVVWAHKTTLSSCEILEIAKEFNVPTRIIHSHSSANMGGKITYLLHIINKRRIFKLATDYLACSEVAAKWFYDDHDCVIVKNGFDISKYKYCQAIRDKIRAQYNLQDFFVIGHVGRFGIEKNHIKLLEIFSLYNQYVANSRLVLCGDGEERSNIETKIKELKLEGKVLLLGMVSNVNEILQSFDVFLMPSLFEGLPYSLLEAQATGLKCVVSNTVSKEADVLGWNEFVPLEAEEQVWVDIIRGIDYRYDRSDAAGKLKNRGFDIIDCVKQINSIIYR